MNYKQNRWKCEELIFKQSKEILKSPFDLNLNKSQIYLSKKDIYFLLKTDYL